MDSPVKIIEPEPRFWRKTWWRRGVKGLVGFALVLLVIWVWPEPRIDLAKVHPELRGLQLPLRKVAIEYYLDGGSIGIRLEDASGKVLEFAIPCDSQAGKYKELRVGAMHVGKAETQPFESPQETMRYLQRLADDNAPLNVNKVAALLSWRTAPRDCLRFVGWVLLNHFDGFGISRATAPVDSVVGPPEPVAK